MNRPTPEHPASPLTFDDPRISEWIDGRLAGSEAELVSRAVAASPELTRFVDDLRLLKAAVAGGKTAVPPAGFVQAVMEAVANNAPVGVGDDPAVDAEWRKLEAERIAEEIAEARDDVTAPRREQRRPPWTWLAMLGSLAAGLLVAVGLNALRQQTDREVAMTPAVAPQSASREILERRNEAQIVADDPAVEEIVVIVDGPNGRATLARILAETGMSEASALADDRIELAAAAPSIEAFKAALAGLSNGGVRLPAVSGQSFAAAEAAVETERVADEKQEQAKAGLSRPQDAFCRLVIRIVAAEGPVADVPPAPPGESKE